MKFLPAAAAFVAASSFLLVPTTASADTYGRYDKWKDVLQIDTSETPGPHFYSPAPDRILGDITQTRIDHQSSVVHVAVYFRKIVRAGGSNAFKVLFQTPDRYRYLTIVASAGHWAGKHQLTGTNGDVPCSKLAWTIEYSHNRLVVDMPRTCLGSPTWVRVGSETDFSAGNTLYQDDAQAADSSGFTGSTLSPKIYR